jgi:SAM-dependent methyltransferase
MRGAMPGDALFDVLSQLSNEEWRDIVVAGDDEPSYRGRPLPTVPPFEVQRRFNGGPDTRSNLKVGYAAYRLVTHALIELGKPLHPRSRVLDFGCGWGRVTRFFLHDVPREHLYGVDVNSIGIEWCRRSLPSENFSLIPSWPPAPFIAGMVDLVYAISVFSHLPEPLHLAWLDEIHRLLRPGGTLVATTLGRNVIPSISPRAAGSCDQLWESVLGESFEDPAAALASYDAGHYVFSAKPGPEYGMALIPQAYVRNCWTKWLCYEGFVDDPAVFPQPRIVMSKPC